MIRYPHAALAAALTLSLTACTGNSAQAERAQRQTPGWAVVSGAPPASTAALDYAAAVATIRRKGFTVDEPTSMPPGPLRAFHAVGTGSMDGTYQAVFLFDGAHLAGAIYGAIFDLVRQDGTRVVVVTPQYGPTDPQCCPSAPSRSHTAELRAGRLTITPPVGADPNHETR